MNRLGITNDLICQPLTFLLEDPNYKHPFRVVRGDLLRNCQQLIQGELDIALISPLEYARYSSELRLVRDVTVFSEQEGRVCLLFFRAAMRELKTIAFQPPEDPYHVLAQLVLNEIYEIEPAWQAVQLPLSVDDALATHEACCYTGNAALEVDLQSDIRLDLIESWSEKMGFAFVHAVVAVRKDFRETRLLEDLQNARELGLRNIPRIARWYARDHLNDWDYYADLLEQFYRYEPDEAIWQQLREYFHYLFYYKKLDYIPELQFI
ncbi:MAG: hypothetical protein GXO78_13510 [Calditrichaeota bacterium]|nr:hypothetical protein [Calditrichota bacterium]